MNIKDKIEKLLNLAQSPNENEARDAMLKARKLMAKYKLDKDDIRENNVKIIDRTTDISCTTMTNYWAVELAKVIAEHYCCKSYVQKITGKKTRTIGFIGLEEDFMICVQIYRYAYKCVNQYCEKIKRKYKGRYTPAEIRNLEYVYGKGFCKGLEEAFEEQQKKNQEWGLVLAIPKEVISIFNSSTETNNIIMKNYKNEVSDRLKRNGYRDGRRFEPSNKLTPGTRKQELE